MNLINKTFTDKVTGQMMTVSNISDGIAIMTNDERVMISRLVDSTHYAESSNPMPSNHMTSDVVDPASFLERDSGNLLNSIMDKVKNIPTDGMLDDNTVNESMSTQNDGFTPNSNESAVIQVSEEDERAELMRKYNVQDQPQTIAADDLIKGSKPQGDVKNFQGTAYEGDGYQPNKPLGNTSPPTPNPQHIQVEDPIVTMFKNVKRNVDFSVDLSISGKIPKIAFIELMEESYNTSIIDYLVDEFTNNLLNDPNQIRKMVKDEINKLVGIVEEEVVKPPAKPRKPRAKAKPRAKTPAKPKTKPKAKPKAKTTKIEASVLPDFKHTPEPPAPPKDRVMKEGEQPVKPNSIK
jgi:hypothetical protein